LAISVSRAVGPLGLGENSDGTECLLWVRRHGATKKGRDGDSDVKIVVAILLIVAVPAYAQDQSRSTQLTNRDAQKVVTIIRSDKAKIQANCEIKKVNEQMNQAYSKNDKKRLDELSQKIERLEKILGPEYVALMDGLQKLAPENSKRIAEILSQFAALDRLCTR